jgi:hypothetical protein
VSDGNYTAYELQAIRKSADVVTDAAVQWVRDSRAVARSFMGKGVFGEVGDENNIPEAYNGIVTGAIGTLDEGANNLEEAAYALYRIAKAYDENEENVRLEMWLAGGGTLESWHTHGRHMKDEE